MVGSKIRFWDLTNDQPIKSARLCVSQVTLVYNHKYIYIDFDQKLKQTIQICIESGDRVAFFITSLSKEFGFGVVQKIILAFSDMDGWIVL